MPTSSSTSSFFGLTLFFTLTLVSGCAKQTLFNPIMPQATGINLTNDIRDFGDILRNFSGHDDGGMLSDPVLYSVKTEYGLSVISMKSLPFKSSQAIANVKPWSSWWYPKKDNDLFVDYNGKRSSTLTKYDYVRQKRNDRLGAAADYEKINYNSNATPWEGLCDAWAIASISSPEPQHPVQMGAGGFFSSSVTFSVADLKALLLKTYEAVDDVGLKYYGQKFTGGYGGWIYPDIFPEQFHRFVEIQLFKQKQAFIMDHDAGIEVWNVPVYKANYIVNQIPNEPNSVFVQMWLYSAEALQSDERNFVGTKESIRGYNYVLQGVRNAQGDLVVNSGYWVKGPDGVDSRKDHPDYLIQIPAPEKLKRKSWNPEIDVSLVDEILSKSY